MKRVLTYEYNYFINQAFDRMPPNIKKKIQHVDFVIGLDASFMGLHNEKYITHIKGLIGAEYADYPHHIDAHLQSCLPKPMRNDTISLPRLRNLYKKGWEPASITNTIIHELGHTLHAAVNFKFSFPPVSAYAETDCWEAFAEAFSFWICPELYPWVSQDLRNTVNAKFSNL